MDQTEIEHIDYLEIVYQDDHLLAINKPHGLLVHPSSIARNANQFAVQILKNQIGQNVFPVHRLDRKTSGVLLFAKDKKTANDMRELFIEKSIQKEYLAIVRGFFPKEVHLDHELTNDKGKTQDAITDFKLIEQTEIDVPFGTHPTSRYSLIRVFPRTGRMHQIRKHCQHLRHPIIGDRPHGCNKQNRLFKSQWNMMTTMLHANSVTFIHPVSKEICVITAAVSSEFKRVLDILKFETSLNKKSR